MNGGVPGGDGGAVPVGFGLDAIIDARVAEAIGLSNRLAKAVEGRFEGGDVEASTVLDSGKKGAIIDPRAFDGVIGCDLKVGTRADLGGGDVASGLAVWRKGEVGLVGIKGGAGVEVGEPIVVPRYRREPRLGAGKAK